MRNTCIIDGRAFRAVPATRGCDGCAAWGYSGRFIPLCNALGPCAGHLRGGGPDIVWVTRGGHPRKAAPGDK